MKVKVKLVVERTNNLRENQYLILEVLERGRYILPSIVLDMKISATG